VLPTSAMRLLKRLWLSASSRSCAVGKRPVDDQPGAQRAVHLLRQRRRRDDKHRTRRTRGAVPHDPRVPQPADYAAAARSNHQQIIISGRDSDKHEPGSPRLTTASTSTSGGTPPNAASKAPYSCCHAASLPISSRRGSGHWSSVRSPPGGTQARTATRTASCARASATAWRNACKPRADPLMPTMTRRRPAT
jgi:hypothetical protein